MTCNANNCDNSKNYSWNDYCSYHERCLSKLQEYSSISDIKEIETFETWFNGNCGYVINYESYYGVHDVWIVVYEPAVKSMSENLSAIKYNTSYISLSSARDKAQDLKRKLQNDSWSDTPMLEVNPNASSWLSFNSLITSPYVKLEEVGNVSFNHYIFYARSEGITPSDLDRHFKPLDIVKIREIHKKFGITYYHFGIYLGDVDNGRKVCHFTEEDNGVRLVSWDVFLKDRIGELYRYHPMIPFKYSRRIAEQIAWTYSNNFQEGQYNLYNRNCEHFANACVYGINYSEQIEDRRQSILFKEGAKTGAAVGLAPFTLGVSLLFAEAPPTLNNDKGSTIKLTNEMRECNGMLREKNNWLSDRIKANIEVPTKEYCRIM